MLILAVFPWCNTMQNFIYLWKTCPLLLQRNSFSFKRKCTCKLKHSFVLYSANQIYIYFCFFSLDQIQKEKKLHLVWPYLGCSMKGINGRAFLLHTIIFSRRKNCILLVYFINVYPNLRYSYWENSGLLHTHNITETKIISRPSYQSSSSTYFSP